MANSRLKLSRRNFLGAGIAAVAMSNVPAARADRELEKRIVTVTGVVRPEELGTTLPHEHVLIDFTDAHKDRRTRHEQDEAFEVILPKLERVGELGCQTLIECTPAHIGRNPLLLKRLSEASGLHLLTNVGYYGARGEQFLPEHAFRENADQLADRWLREWRDGIEGTGIRPGFIKITVDEGPLSDVSRKLVQAAARTHHKSGLTIAGHAGDARAAFGQLDVLKQEGLAGNAWIWVHAQREADSAVHRRAAERGAWIEFDRISPSSIEQHLAMVRDMKKHGLLDRVLISHDAGWYSIGEPGGGKFRDYNALFTHFLPALKEAGFTGDEIHQITVINPAEAFTVCVRTRK